MLWLKPLLLTAVAQNLSLGLIKDVISALAKVIAKDLPIIIYKFQSHFLHPILHTHDTFHLY